MPAATEKISSSSHLLRWLSTWMARNISAASVMAVTTYHRRQPGCWTIHAASRLRTARLASKMTSDQSRGGRVAGKLCQPSCHAAQGQQGRGHKAQRHQGIGRLEGRLGQLGPLPHGQAIADQEHQPCQREGERVVFRGHLPVLKQLPDGQAGGRRTEIDVHALLAEERPSAGRTVPLPRRSTPARGSAVHRRWARRPAAASGARRPPARPPA